MNINFLTNWKTLISVMAIITASVVACGSNTKKQEEVQPNSSIKGTITGASNELVILRELTIDKGMVFLDSARTDDKGRFELGAIVNRETIVLLNIKTDRSYGVPLVMNPDGKIKIELSNVPNFPEASVKADEVNDQMLELYNLYAKHNRALMDFKDRVDAVDMRTLSDSMKKALNDEYLVLTKSMIDEVTDFIKTGKGTIVSYFAAVFIIDQPPIEMQDAALTAMKKDSPEAWYTKDLDDRLAATRPLNVGMKAPEIALQSPDGQIIKLSSLQGKYVLIDFWASWCGPCRRENPNVVRMYNKYHNKGFEIYGVSLDKEDAKWKAAIQQDGLTWVHVSDLKGWQSSAAARYKIHAIPATVLIDKDGVIIAKDLRGAALEAKLSEIFD